MYYSACIIKIIIFSRLISVDALHWSQYIFITFYFPYMLLSYNTTETKMQLIFVKFFFSYDNVQYSWVNSY